MRIAMGLLVGALILAPGLAAAQEVRVEPGQELTLTINDAGKAHVELWPHPIDALELRDIALVPFRPHDDTACE